MLKFTVVRHPVDWHFSIYRWILKWRGRRLTAPVYSDTFNIQTFEDYLQWRIKHGVIPQLTQLVDYDGRLLINRICRLEFLDSDVAKMFEELGITAKVPMLNVGSVKRPHLTNKEVDLVLQNYSEDLIAFGYSRKGVNQSWCLDKERLYPSAGAILKTLGADEFDPWAV